MNKDTQIKYYLLNLIPGAAPIIILLCIKKLWLIDFKYKTFIFFLIISVFVTCIPLALLFVFGIIKDAPFFWVNFKSFIIFLIIVLILAYFLGFLMITIYDKFMKEYGSK